MELLSAQNSSIGKERKNNEDSIRSDNALGIYVVADGVSIHPEGGKASKIAVDSIFNYIRNNSTQGDKSSLLKQAIQKAHTAILSYANRNKDLHGMGSTAVVLLVDNQTLYVCWVGDSRAYLLRSGRLSRLSKDQHTSKNSLAENYLGSTKTPSPGLRTVNIQSGDHFILCSDGLSNMVDDTHIQSTMAGHLNNPSSIAESLVSLANQNGGEDNSSVIAVVAKSLGGVLPSHYVIPGSQDLIVWEGSNIFIK